MSAVGHDLVAAREDVANRCVVSGKDPRVEGIILISANQRFVIGVEHDDVSPRTGQECADAPPARRRAAAPGTVQKGVGGRAMMGASCHVSRPGPEPLAIFEHPKFAGRAAAHVRIGPDGPVTPVLLQDVQREDPVTQVCFRGGAEPYHGS